MVDLAIVRKHTTKKLSQYLKEIEKKIISEFVKGLPEAVDDDNRGMGALSVERIGHADNLTMGAIIPKNQLCKTIYEGGQGDLALHLYMSDVNSPNPRDRSGWTGYTETSALFAGGNDEINCGNDAALWSQSLTKFSMSFWIFPTKGWDGTTRLVLNHGSGNQRFNVHIPSATNGRIIFRVVNNVGTSFDAFSDSLKLYRWNHITCVYDSTLGSNNVKIYVNGVVGTNATLTQAINQSANLLLGTDGSTGMEGNMRDFRWWTTTALTAADALGFSKLSPVPAPDYWLKLTNSSLIDAISKTKTATMNNGTVFVTKDYTKTISRFGNPCVVKTTQSFIGRKEVGYFDGISDGLLVKDHEQLRIINNPDGFSISYWTYIPNGADTPSPVVDPASINLDGNDDYIQCGDQSLWSASLTKFTFSLWVYSPANPASDRWIVSHGGSNNHGIRLIYRVSDGKLQFNIKSSGGSNIAAVSDSALPLNTWTHVMCVYDNVLGSANLKIYINGVLQATTGNLTEAINLADEMTIGTEAVGTTPLCKVKQFWWYKNKALTAGQADAQAKGFVWNNDVFPDYYLPMWEHTGNPVDVVNGVLEGVLTNGASWDLTNYPPYFEVQPRIIYQKNDDGNGTQLQIFLDPLNKRLVIQIFESGFQGLRYIDNAYAYDTWVHHVVTFNPSTNTVTMIKNGASQTLVAADTWANYDPAIVDAFIAIGAPLFETPAFNIGSNLALYNFKFWNRVITTGEALNETNNKFSISNVTTAQLPILGFATVAYDPSQGVYMPDVYLPQTYETG